MWNRSRRIDSEYIRLILKLPQFWLNKPTLPTPLTCKMLKRNQGGRKEKCAKKKKGFYHLDRDTVFLSCGEFLRIADLVDSKMYT